MTTLLGACDDEVGILARGGACRCREEGMRQTDVQCRSPGGVGAVHHFLPRRTCFFFWTGVRYGMALLRALLLWLLVACCYVP